LLALSYMVSPLCRLVNAKTVNLFLPNLGFGRLVLGGGYKLTYCQLSTFISLNCVSGLVMHIHVHLLANTSNFVSGKVI
jgi:hypothetical protein